MKGGSQSARWVDGTLHIDVFNLIGDSNTNKVVCMSFVHKTWKNSSTQTIEIPIRNNWVSCVPESY